METEINLTNLIKTCNKTNQNSLEIISEKEKIVLTNIPDLETKQPINTITLSSYITQNGNYTIQTPDDYDGIKEVNLKVDIPPKTEDMLVKLINQNGQQTFLPEPNHTFGQVSITTDVNPPLQTLSHIFTNNGNYLLKPDENHYGLNAVNASINVQPALQAKDITIQENATATYTPDSNYYGFSKITITTNIPEEKHTFNKLYYSSGTEALPINYPTNIINLPTNTEQVTWSELNIPYSEETTLVKSSHALRPFYITLPSSKSCLSLKFANNGKLEPRFIYEGEIFLAAGEKALLVPILFTNAINWGSIFFIASNSDDEMAQQEDSMKIAFRKDTPSYSYLPTSLFSNRWKALGN
ncbi:Hypothetical protein EHI5A_265120 [Entamoeba histolytica KU27]|uniref:Uncharacterized protein n=1 Tax=Entamoeba histolytica KU27 TaxID=885311 RepID=M2S1P0_ENTHI|nr:Hypothetical protein EHI5A_265120 [Entamoeba histolytica KU27]